MSRKVVENHPELVVQAPYSITFNTANGLAPATEQANLVVTELGKEVMAWVMGKSPAVLSMGYQCMECRYSFLWPNGRTPYLIDHDTDMIVRLRVKGNIPYLVPGG